MSKRDGMTPISVRVPDELAELFKAECAEKETNQTVLLSTIFARRYKRPYKPSEISKRRTTPHGGGSGRPR